MTTNIPRRQKADPRYAELLYLPALPIPGVQAAIDKEWMSVLRKQLNNKCPHCGQELPESDG